MKRDEIEKLVKRVSEASDLINDRASEVAREFERTARLARKAAATYRVEIAEAEQNARRFMLSLEQACERIAPYIERVAGAIQELPDQTKEELEALASHGWYIDPDMPCSASTELAGYILDGKLDEAHSRLEAYFDSESTKIAERLLSLYPSRAAILSAAFRAHRESSYALSVPIFLAQADGICKEHLGVQLYGKTQRGKSTQVRDALHERKIDPFLESILAPLLRPYAINANSADLTDSDLNRHAVLHGESVTYDTFRNSCKAISLLAFTSWALGSALNDA